MLLNPDRVSQSKFHCHHLFETGADGSRPFPAARSKFMAQNIPNSPS